MWHRGAVWYLTDLRGRPCSGSGPARQGYVPRFSAANPNETLSHFTRLPLAKVKGGGGELGLTNLLRAALLCCPAARRRRKAIVTATQSPKAVSDRPSRVPSLAVASTTVAVLLLFGSTFLRLNAVWQSDPNY